MHLQNSRLDASFLVYIHLNSQKKFLSKIFVFNFSTSISKGNIILEEQEYKFEGLFPGLTLTTLFIIYMLTADISKNNKEASSPHSPTTKTLKRTTSQSSLGGTLRTSTVAHTVSPTPSVLSNISALSIIDRLTCYINFSFLCVLNRPNTNTNKRIKQ